MNKFSFKNYVALFSFNKGVFNQVDFEVFIENNFTQNIGKIIRQVLSKQRTYINPIIFEEINKEYSCLIKYNKNNIFFQ